MAGRAMRAAVRRRAERVAPEREVAEPAPRAPEVVAPEAASLETAFEAATATSKTLKKAPDNDIEEDPAVKKAEADQAALLKGVEAAVAGQMMRSQPSRAAA